MRRDTIKKINEDETVPIGCGMGFFIIENEKAASCEREKESRRFAGLRKEQEKKRKKFLKQRDKLRRKWWNSSGI